MRIVEKSQLMSAPEIDRTLQRLAHEIVEKSGGTKNLALIGIVRRGVPLARRIAQAMRGIDGVDVPVAFWTLPCIAMTFQKWRRKRCCALRTFPSAWITWTWC